MKLQESQTLELKAIWKDEYRKTVCAFASTDGGVLYIGVDDNATIVGISKAAEFTEVLPNKINSRLGLLVDVVIKEVDDKQYLEIIVPKTYAPVSYGGKFYQRSGANY